MPSILLYNNFISSSFHKEPTRVIPAQDMASSVDISFIASTLTIFLPLGLVSVYIIIFDYP